MDTAIYTLTSELHDEGAVSAVTQEFLGSLGCEYELKGSDFTDYGSHPLDLIFVRTGGTENLFRRMLPELRKKSCRPFYLLASGKSNSLAASMEILSFLHQHGLQGEIVHGSAAYIHKRIRLLAQVGEARKTLNGCRLGVIGKPSDWLISSGADCALVKERLGVELVDIPMEELLDAISAAQLPPSNDASPVEAVSKAIPGANRIYEGLKLIVGRHQLQGFTLRCFDLLATVKNTGCLALAKLNAQGYVAGCEGDIPAMLSMIIVRSLTGLSGFQANPSSVNPEKGEIVFAHCTIPLDMVERYEYDTHFESGIGVGIRGFMKEGPVTIFKVSGDLQRCFIAEGELVKNQCKPDLCRTQQVICLAEKGLAHYFLTEPIGNHHIIIPGKCKDLISQFLLIAGARRALPATRRGGRGSGGSCAPAGR